MWLNYHHLYYFRTIATEGSIAKAAKKLRLGQPTLSTQLRQLERAIGLELFERRGRTLVLTEAGRLALEYANEIFRLGEEMIEVVQDRLTTSRPHIAIGALDSVPKYIVSALAQHAYRTSNCTISILEGKGDELFRELSAHRIDLVLSNFPTPAGELKGVFSRSIARLPVVVCGAERFKALRKGFPRSLAGQPFVLPTSHSKLRQDLEHYFRTNDLQVEPIAETQDTGVQHTLGISGIGLVPMAESAAAELVREKKLIVLGRLENVVEEIWLISASRRIENPIAAKLMRTFALH